MPEQINPSIDQGGERDYGPYTNGKADISPEMKATIEAVSKMNPQEDADPREETEEKNEGNVPNKDEQIH